MFDEQETKILARLQAKLGGAVTVDTLRELERVPENVNKAPAAWLVYNGFRPGVEIPNASPGVQQLVHEWIVVVVARSARGNGDSNDARDMAASIALKVIQALLGFDVGGGKRLRLAETGGPEYDAGYCELPLAFSCAMTVKGDL